MSPQPNPTGSASARSVACRIFILACFALLCVHASAASPSPLDRDLAGCWSFNDCDGRTVKDRSPLGNDGAIEFGELRREKTGASLEFDGLGGHILIREQKPFNFTNALTASLWVNAAELRNNTVLFGIQHENPGWTTPMFGMYSAEGRVVFGMWLNGGKGKTLVEAPKSLPLKTWTHLAGTYDGKTARLYINGALAAEKPAQGPVTRNGQPLLIGQGLGAKPSLKGRIGELRLYRRALSDTEVHDLFNQTQTAYDLTAPTEKKFNDGTVSVETHANSPDSSKPWLKHPTRLLDKLDGYHPSSGQVKLDRFGGCMDRPREQATGFFYIKKIDGRHWLIDPEGYRFYHVAMNTAKEPRNLPANYGSPEKWAEALTAQLREAGFDGLGNGNSILLTQVKTPLVWVLRKDFMFAFAREKKLVSPAAGTQGFPDRCMPVFHPDFEPFCERFAKDLAATANDPNLLGIMTDNEIQCPVDLLDRYLKLDPANPTQKPGRDAATAWLTARKGSVDLKAINQHDRYEFIAYAFERYYQIVSRVIRANDPHHLYLGSRINYHQGEFDNPWFWKMLAKYHDVVSVNYYSEWGPDKEQFAQWAAWSDKPVLLTEWYAKAMDAPGLANRLGAGWLVRTQQDRAAYYQHFALNALEIPNIVGWHWFKYLDDPAESKALDAAGGANKGMFDLQGRPYAPLLERASAVNREVYPLIEFFDKRER